jgi:stringent starvation protein B
MDKDKGKDQQGTSTRPYLIRALHDWCTDNGFTPYLAVQVGAQVQVPMEYVNNNEIVLNVGFEATSGLKLGNEFIEFNARFGGVARQISVPVGHVLAIYARENGQGMAFPAPSAQADEAANAAESSAPSEPGSEHRTKPSPLPILRGLRLAGSELGKDEAKSAQDAETHDSEAATNGDGDEPKPAGPGRPTLKRIK